MGWQLRLADRYRLVERLGDRGGVEVWHALDETLSRPVRVEVVTAAVVPAKTDRDRLAANVRRAARVRHPAIATIYDCDVTRDGHGSLAVYAVSEFVEGVALTDAAALDELPLAEALNVLCQIAGALAAAHRMGVVHGGLGPTEVVLTAHGAKVSGFGIRDLPGGGSGGPYEAASEANTGTGLALLHSGAAGDVAALGAMISDRLIERPLPEDVRHRLVLLRRWCQATDPGARPTAGHVLEALTSLRAAANPDSGIRLQATPDPPPYVPLTPLTPEQGPTDIGPATQDFGPYAAEQGPTAIPPGPGSGSHDHFTRILSSAGSSAPSQEGPRTARRLLIGACVLGAATVAALIFVANQPQPVRTAAGPQTTSAAPPQNQNPQDTPPPTQAPIGDVSPAAALATLDRLRQAVNRSDLAGKIRQDVALDLRNVIGNLENDLTSGHPVDVKRRLTDIEQKIGTRLREGGLDTETATHLTQIITAKRG